MTTRKDSYGTEWNVEEIIEVATGTKGTVELVRVTGRAPLVVCVAAVSASKLATSTILMPKTDGEARSTFATIKTRVA